MSPQLVAHASKALSRREGIQIAKLFYVVDRINYSSVLSIL